MSELDGQPRKFYPRCRAILQVEFDNYAISELGGHEKPLVIPVLPKSATVHRNKHNQADSWELEFSAADLDFDPKTVRAGEAQIYFFDAGSQDDSALVASRQNPTTRAPSATVNDPFTHDYPPIIVGLFDDQSMEMSNDGRWVRIKGQDYTQLLLKHWPPVEGTHRARRIPVGQPLVTWARALLKEVDPSGRINVRFDGANPLTIATRATGEDLGPIVGKGEISGNKRGIPIQQETTYFDVFYKVCLRLGYICEIQGLDLVISQPRNLSSFKPADIRAMAWGNNIEHLSMSRHLGKEKVPRVIMKAWDDDRHLMIVVEVPDGGPHAKEIALAKNPSRKTHAIEHIKAAVAKTHAKKPHHHKATTLHKEDEFIIIPVHGISSPEALQRAGETYRTLIGRGERKVIVKTHDLVDIDGLGILDVKSGDPFYVRWQDFNKEAFSNPAKSFGERVDWLKAHGYQPDVAAVLAGSYDRMFAKAERPLRVREATFQYDADNGLEIEMELQDFVMVGGVRGGGQSDAQYLDAILGSVGIGKAAIFQ
jgi:hypothetical protein